MVRNDQSFSRFFLGEDLEGNVLGQGGRKIDVKKKGSKYCEVNRTLFGEKNEYVSQSLTVGALMKAGHKKAVGKTGRIK